MTIQPPIDKSIEITDQLWARILPLLPPRKKRIKQGRPRLDDRLAMASILYKLSTGQSWKALPRRMGAGSTLYDRYQEWRKAGVFDRLRFEGIFNMEDEASEA